MQQYKTQHRQPIQAMSHYTLSRTQHKKQTSLMDNILDSAESMWAAMKKGLATDDETRRLKKRQQDRSQQWPY
jgi:hypothetical protein